MTRQGKINIIVVSGTAIFLACLFVPTWAVSTDVTRICPRCGAQEHFTRGLFGAESARRVEPGPLTDWLAAHGVAHEHEWRGMHHGGRNIFGRDVSAASSNPPPVLFAFQDKLASFLATGSESDVNEFLNAMLHGSREEQERAIRKHGLAE